MPNNKPRRRRKKSSSHNAQSAVATITLQPGEVPPDDVLDAEAAALEEETQGKYDLAKKDDLSLSALQHMSMDELGKLAKKQKVSDYQTLPKQKLVFEILNC